MSSPTSSQSNPYAFQRAGSMATRSLVSDEKPTEYPSSSSLDSPDDASTAADKPQLQRRTTNNYEQAVSASQAGQPTTAASNTAEPGADRPGLDRQQSWDVRDMRRQGMEKVLSGADKDAGYTSAQK